MLTETLQGALYVLWRRKKTWWVPLWAMILWIVLVFLGGMIILPMRHDLGSSLSAQDMSALGHQGTRLAFLGILAVLTVLGALPFTFAAAYGTIAEAVRGESLGVASFWRNGLKYYGRAWGFFGILLLLWLGFAVIVALLDLGARHLGVAGVIVLAVIAIAGTVLLVLWSNWSAGAIFVGRKRWGGSLKDGLADTRRHWGATLLLMLVLFAVGLLFELLGDLLTKTLGAAGSGLYLLVDIIFAFYSLMAYLMLYAVAHQLAGSRSEDGRADTDSLPPPSSW